MNPSTTLTTEASAVRSTMTIMRLKWSLEDDNIIQLCQRLSNPELRQVLPFQLRTGDMSVELLNQIKQALEDPNNQMYGRSRELADARMQVLRLYRAIDMHSWKFMPWILSIDRSLGRTLRVIGLCLTPSSIFH